MKMVILTMLMKMMLIMMKIMMIMMRTVVFTGHFLQFIDSVLRRTNNEGEDSYLQDRNE